MPATYEVRLTPLFLGTPGVLEQDGGITTIAKASTTVVPQFLDDRFEVNIAINEGLTGTVVIPIGEPVVEDLQPFAQAVWIAYKRPAAVDAEAIIYGPCNVETDYEAGTVTLTVQDPSLRCQHHYVRRGDAVLNLDDDKGAIQANADSIAPIITAARNTMEQQDRDVPALAFDVWNYGTNVAGAPLIGLERGQEVWDLVQQVLRSETAPDAYSAPLYAWGATFASYSELGMYDPMTDPAAPGGDELGRNRDPTDPDDPQPGEVIFDYGLGLDNLIGLVESPERPTTHVHVVDADRKYRITRADAASSAAVGVFVDWIATDYKVVGGDTGPLEELAAARIRALGNPPRHFTCTLRPDDAQPYHYGHWFFGGDTIGDFQIGDFVRVRAARGYRSFSTLARIMAAKFGMQGGLPLLELTMVPALPGVADTDPQGN